MGFANSSTYPAGYECEMDSECGNFTPVWKGIVTGIAGPLSDGTLLLVVGTIASASVIAFVLSVVTLRNNVPMPVAAESGARSLV
jgi:hypothetical protein